ncbi:SlyX family protein [Chitinivibrio alkaliphilus]|uniref:SlyX protein n=1 Tax=Chitinivibrio alkaliphilus ACht1 TaxID=1313304 RepID=U7D9C9_9BACT|nr:SlyX family protein [Chitinivibrio alkaliphilus]ERP32186.1 SlyX protein [Chitinivibrio alkaliphilus ACht1]
MDQQIINVETKIAFLEHHLDEVNKTLFRQEEEIQLLQECLRQLQEKVKNNDTTSVGHISEEPPPPHY